MALRETLERISKMDAPTSERSTIRQIIMPVLSVLGWDVDNSSGTHEVREEYPVSSLKGSGKVDIALMVNRDQCACLLEAKSPGINLDDHVMQLFRYDVSNASGTICVLTDGLEWRLYLPRESGNPEERQFARLRLREDPVEQIADDFKKFLSRSAVVSGEAEQNAINALKQLREESKRLKRENDIARELPSIWRKMLTEPDEVLVDRVRRKVYEELMFSVSVEQVSEFLAARIAPSQSDFRDRTDSDKAGARTRKQRKILGATVLGVEKELGSGKDMWKYVVEQVHARHPQDFLEKAAQLRGTKREFVSGSYQNKNRPEEVGDTGVFVETDMKIDEFERRSRELLKLFGYSSSDLEIHEG